MSRSEDSNDRGEETQYDEETESEIIETELEESYNNESGSETDHEINPAESSPNLAIALNTLQLIGMINCTTDLRFLSQLVLNQQTSDIVRSACFARQNFIINWYQEQTLRMQRISAEQNPEVEIPLPLLQETISKLSAIRPETKATISLYSLTQIIQIFDAHDQHNQESSGQDNYAPDEELSGNQNEPIE